MSVVKNRKKQDRVKISYSGKDKKTAADRGFIWRKKIIS